MGPILIFDKSTLEGLNVDQAVWLDTFYYPNITPLFFMETLADLEKEVAAGRRPEQVVGNLAEKTPIQSGGPNVHHTPLYIESLLGRKIPMDNRVLLAGGTSYVKVGGRRGLIIERSAEMEALERWQRGEFLKVERMFAKAWRTALAALDLSRSKVRLVGGETVRDLGDAKRVADELVGRDGERYQVLRFALDRAPPRFRADVIRRWKEAGGPKLVDFAPYAAYVLTVDLFFSFATGAGLESTERPGHRIDLAYLYYLPFCMVFASSDKFHERVVPLFLTGKQVFIRGQELKADLAKLDGYYSRLPEEIKQQGVMKFAHYPPVDGDFLTSQLWDRFMRPEWRTWATEKPKAISKDDQERIVKQVKAMKQGIREGQSVRTDSDSMDMVQIQRSLPVRRGKWRLLPPGVENREKGE